MYKEVVIKGVVGIIEESNISTFDQDGHQKKLVLYRSINYGSVAIAFLILGSAYLVFTKL